MPNHLGSRWEAERKRTKLTLAFLAALILLLSWTESALAFPELVRHGYANCLACHVSPTGGGVLSQYGRQLINEVLVTTSRPGEETFTFGETPSWLAMGGDLRTLNLRRELPSGAKVDSLILMQADVEAAVNAGPWTAAGTIGRLDTAVYPQGSDWISRRHYLLYRPSEELMFEAGRYQVPYGIQMADHYTYIKKNLGWDTDTETYNLEAHWITEKYSVTAGASIGRPDDRSLVRDSGADVSGSFMAGDAIKLGLSYHYGTNDFAHRHVFGPWGIIGLGHRAFILAELDFQRNFAFSFENPQWGLVNYVRADVEPIQGLHFFGTQETSKLDFSNSGGRMLRWGLGTQFFPRPHFEVEGMWLKEQQLAVSQDFRETLWLLLHYYL